MHRLQVRQHLAGVNVGHLEINVVLADEIIGLVAVDVRIAVDEPIIELPVLGVLGRIAGLRIVHGLVIATIVGDKDLIRSTVGERSRPVGVSSTGAERFIVEKTERNELLTRRRVDVEHHLHLVLQQELLDGAVFDREGIVPRRCRTPSVGDRYTVCRIHDLCATRQIEVYGTVLVDGERRYGIALAIVPAEGDLEVDAAGVCLLLLEEMDRNPRTHVHVARAVDALVRQIGVEDGLGQRRCRWRRHLDGDGNLHDHRIRIVIIERLDALVGVVLQLVDLVVEFVFKPIGLLVVAVLDRLLELVKQVLDLVDPLVAAIKKRIRDVLIVADAISRGLGEILPDVLGCLEGTLVLPEVLHVGMM